MKVASPISYDDIINLLLIKAEISLVRDLNHTTGFNRGILFAVNGLKYKIIWYRNISHLYIQGNKINAANIPFHTIELSNNSVRDYKELIFGSFLDDRGRLIYESFKIPLK